MRRIVISVLALVGSLACGGDGEKETDVRTRSGPTQFNGVSAQFRRTHGSSPGVSFQELAVGVFDIPPWCYPADGGAGPPAVSTLVIEIVRQGVDPVGTGTWPASPPGTGLFDGAIVTYQRIAAGQPDVFLKVSSGSVTVSRADDTAAEGEVDLTLEDGTHLDGRFSATPQCIR
jgi:hypothetical protein